MFGKKKEEAAPLPAPATVITAAFFCTNCHASEERCYSEVDFRLQAPDYRNNISLWSIFNIGPLNWKRTDNNDWHCAVCVAAQEAAAKSALAARRAESPLYKLPNL